MTCSHPKRVVCLSAEAVEILYEIGCSRRLVGVTGYATQPPAARRKPRVSGFSKVHYDRVDALRPDLIITFSDVQAAAAQELIRRGHTVLATNQRSLADIYATIRLLGQTMGRPDEAEKLIRKLRQEIARPHPSHKSRPKVYFEEWNEPFISGIRWVSELIEAAGGEDIFSELRTRSRASDRVVTSDEIIHRQPDLIMASWCGKKVKVKKICQRPGWQNIPAIRHGRIYEIPSAHILQPGPSLLKGFPELRRIIEKWNGS